MDSLVKALKELNKEIQNILELHNDLEVQKPTLIIKDKKERKRKEKTQSVKNSIPIVRFIAPDGKKIQVNFNDTSPSMEVVADIELNRNY
jgi:hypothetical protein